MSDIVNKNENLELELEDNTILSNLFGINDRNLSLIEQINQVKIQYRGNKIKISGNKKSIFETKKTILNLFKEAQNGAEIDEDRIRDNKSLISMNIKSDKQMDLFIQTKKRKIIPRTEIQNKYLQLLNTKNITFAIGPAGTGKTFVALYLALKDILDPHTPYNQLYIVRSLVSTREIGFLPGDHEDKSFFEAQLNQMEEKAKAQAYAAEKKEMLSRDSLKVAKLNNEIAALKDMLTITHEEGAEKQSKVDSVRFAMLDNELQSLRRMLLQATLKDSIEAQQQGQAQIEAELATREKEKAQRDSLIEEKNFSTA